jgi:hypothetical protein
MRRDIVLKLWRASESGQTCRKHCRDLVEVVCGSLVVLLVGWIVSNAGAMLRSTGKEVVNIEGSRASESYGV